MNPACKEACKYRAKKPPPIALPNEPAKPRNVARREVDMKCVLGGVRCRRWARVYVNAEPVSRPFRNVDAKYAAAGASGLEVDRKPRRSRVKGKRANATTHAVQKEPVRRMWIHPTRRPPSPNPRFVGMRIEPASTGLQERIASA